jgi:hypothetical protein
MTHGVSSLLRWGPKVYSFFKKTERKKKSLIRIKVTG